MMNECSLTVLFDGGLERLHLDDEVAVNGLNRTVRNEIELVC